jgi:hypothetical protein
LPAIEARKTTPGADHAEWAARMRETSARLTRERSIWLAALADREAHDKA